MNQKPTKPEKLNVPRNNHIRQFANVHQIINPCELRDGDDIANCAVAYTHAKAMSRYGTDATQ